MYRAGIDLGGTNIKAGIVDEQQHIIAEASVPTNVERPYQEIIRDMAELVKTLLKQKGIGETQLKSIGIGSPGTIDAVHGVVLYSNNFGWENVPLTEQLKKYFSCPIAVSNDANCAALGEVKAGAARHAKNAILLTLGTGVGGGIILDGKVFEGAHAGGAELGHTSLICGGQLCTCGRKGCVEAYVSATALIRDAKRAAQQHPESILNAMCEGDLSHMNGKIPFDAAQDGDTAAEKVVSEGISVHSLEELTQGNEYKKSVKVVKNKTDNSEYKYIEKDLKEKLGTSVKINNNKLVIKFSNVQDLNRILEIMNISID